MAARQGRRRQPLKVRDDGTRMIIGRNIPRSPMERPVPPEIRLRDAVSGAVAALARAPLAARLRPEARCDIIKSILPSESSNSPCWHAA